MNPKELTFTIKHKLIRISYADEGHRPSPEYYPVHRDWPKIIKYESGIIDYRRKYELKWTVSRDSISNRVWSDIVGEMFVAEYDMNLNRARLILCGLPSKEQVGTYIDGLQVYLTLNVKECRLFSHGTIVFEYGYDPSKITIDGQCLNLSHFDMNNYKELNEFTFCLDIEIMHEIAMDGHIINNQIGNDWDQIIFDKKEKEMEAESIKWVETQRGPRAEISPPSSVCSSPPIPSSPDCIAAEGDHQFRTRPCVQDLNDNNQTTQETNTENEIKQNEHENEEKRDILINSEQERKENENEENKEFKDWLKKVNLERYLKILNLFQCLSMYDVRLMCL